MKTVYTVAEFNTMKLYELDNVTYNKMQKKLAKLLNDKKANQFLESHLGMEVKKFTANSFVNFMDCFSFI